MPNNHYQYQEGDFLKELLPIVIQETWVAIYETTQKQKAHNYFSLTEMILCQYATCVGHYYDIIFISIIMKQNYIHSYFFFCKQV